MFVLSIKTGKKQLISVLGGICAVALIGLLALAVPPSDKPSSSDIPVVSTRGGTGEERVSFLKHLGYETESEAVEVQEIRLPDQTDETIAEYNKIQKQIGFDLEAYLGKRVKCYKYRILNAETEPSHAYLYVYRDTVIAGHIATANGDIPLM